jgi:hypothetical protein
MNNIPDYKKLNLEILQEYIILDIWTLEEYIALLLQLNPEHFPNLKELINTPRGEKLYKLIIKGINADILPCKITRNLYGSQPPLYEFTPLDAVMFATKKGILLFDGMEELAKKHHNSEAEDLKAELEKAKNRIKELEEQLNKKSQEDDLNTKTKNGYDRAIATIAVALWSDNSKIDENLNAHNIIKKCDVRNSNFNYIKDEQTLRKYIGPARERLGLPYVYQK